MINREIQSELERLLPHFRVFVVTGLRRMPELLQHIH